MSFPKTGKSLPRPDSRYRRDTAIFATCVSDALRGALGNTHVAVKTVMRWTPASERSIKGWMAGTSGPSGDHLIDLVRHSDAVLEAFLAAAGRSDLVLARKLLVLQEIASEILAIIGRLGAIGRLDPTGAGSMSGAGALTGPESAPVVDPADVPGDRFDGLNNRQRWFIAQLARGHRVKAGDVGRYWGVSEKTAKRDIAVLRGRDLIVFTGARKTGCYRLIE